MLPIAFHPTYQLPLPVGHRFPMLKYDLLPKQLVLEGIAIPTDFFEPEMCDLDSILAIHDLGYVTELLDLTLNPKAVRKIGFPLSKMLLERELRITQGTITGARKSLKTKISFNIAGGTHHAFTSHGEAFCLLNDQAVAAQFLLNHKLAKKILIIDLDVHQGNGTAQIFANNPSVFTFSAHGKNNYPFRKEKSDLDIAFDDKTTDGEFLKTIESTIPRLIETHQPDFIFYLAGVDILGSDQLGKLNCTVEGCKRRDELVFQFCVRYQIPAQVSMGGGYSPNIKTIVEAHANTYRAAKSIF